MVRKDENASGKPDPEVGFSAFISHASGDREKASSICASLEASGFRCWIAPRDVRPGQDYASEIIRGIEASKALVLVLSADANKSPFVQAEVERAYSKGKPVFPIRIEDVVPSRSLELFISTKHWIDAWQGNVADHSAALVRALLEDSDVEISIPVFRRIIRLSRWTQLGILTLVAAAVAGGAAYLLQPDPMAGYDPTQNAARFQFIGSLVGDYYPLEVTYFLQDAHDLTNGEPMGGLGNMRHFELFDVDGTGKTELLYEADPKDFANEYNRSRPRKIALDSLPKRVIACFAYASSDQSTSHVVVEGFNFDRPESIAALFPVTAAGPREADVDPTSMDCQPYAVRYATKYMSKGKSL